MFSHYCIVEILRNASLDPGEGEGGKIGNNPSIAYYLPSIPGCSEIQKF